MAAKKRKNFLPTLILAIIFWGLWGGLTYFVPPTTNLSLIAFYSSLFLAIFLTAALIFANSKLGLLTALFTITALIFQQFKINNLLNFGILVAIFITLGLYFRKD